MATKKNTRKNTKRKNTSATRKKSPAKKRSPLAREITFLAILVFGILSLMSVFHMCGVFGEILSGFLFGMVGALAYVFPVYLIIASGLYISNSDNKKLHHKIWCSIGVYWCLCGMFEWVVNHPVNTIWNVYQICSENQSGGGFLGGILSFGLGKIFGRGGSLIVILALTIVFAMILSGKLFFSALYRLYEERENKRDYVEYEEEVVPAVTNRQMNTYKFEKESSLEEESKKRKSRKKKQKSPVLTEIIPEESAMASAKKADEPKRMVQDPSEITIIRSSVDKPSGDVPVYKEELERKFGGEESLNNATVTTDGSIKGMSVNNGDSAVEKKPEKVKITKEDEKEMAKVQAELSKATAKEVPYKFPSLDLLNRPKAGKKGMGNDELRDTAMKLQSTLDSFGVRVKMGDISLGPSVARYELIPEQGVKVNKITSLADDIKLSLAATDIRIEAPIPGKAAVGIEVPNRERTMITLRELLESNEFNKAKSKLTFAVGKDISGQTIVTDIAKMPHLLIAGATGSGKSVLVNTLIMSIIYKASPNEVKMIMVDPKMVEFAAYEDIPHLMIPVVKDPKKASAALGWAVAEMEQ